MAKKGLSSGVAVIIAISAASLLMINGCVKGRPKADISKPAVYVGAEKCKECHERIYAGWKTTMHPYKFQDATPDAVVGDFQKNNTYTAGGYTTRMEKRGDEFSITTMGPDNKEHTYKIKYLIGSVWKQRYVTEFPNGALHILPVQWNVKTQEWVDYHGLKKHKPGDGKYWSDKTRTYQFKCTGCHNTGSEFQYDAATDTFTGTKWADKGVACEACHGPGSNHVVAEGEDLAKTIVNPAKIYDPARAAMVCGQCHTRGSSAEKLFGVQKTGYPFDYRPGGQLNFVYDEKPGLHPDGTSRKHHQQYIDWKKSGHAEAGVQCWDCHYTHRQGNSNRYQTKLPGSLLCKNCHIDIEQKGYHGIHSENNCIGCHMAPAAKSAVSGDIHSHSFRVMKPQETVRLGGKQPNACNLCHYHKKDRPEDLARVLDEIKKQAWGERNIIYP
ncbi:MAG: hypothetical protein GXP49_05215 [Deltaproteobacteria bacterium]|nr:hypothetical protein [Deltaproteobacteria bacterium]